jgi:general secretion pathway protein J
VRGFTLLEVLVAMSIFAVIGLGANQMLRTMIDTHERTEAVARSSGQMNRALLMIERDVSQLVLRPVRDEYGEVMPALMANTGVYPLEFTRSGWNNPALLPRSSMQRVAYELTVDGKLTRHTWLVLDRAEDSEPVSQTLLTDVEDFRVNLQHESGVTDTWPSVDATSELPLSVEVVIAIEERGEISRLFALVSEPKPVRESERDGNRDGNGDGNGNDNGNDNDNGDGNPEQRP